MSFARDTRERRRGGRGGHDSDSDDDDRHRHSSYSRNRDSRDSRSSSSRYKRTSSSRSGQYLPTSVYNAQPRVQVVNHTVHPGVATHSHRRPHIGIARTPARRRAAPSASHLWTTYRRWCMTATQTRRVLPTSCR
jgi:hypothetical protein